MLEMVSKHERREDLLKEVLSAHQLSAEMGDHWNNYNTLSPSDLEFAQEQH